MSQPIVYVVDDDRSVRDGLQRLISSLGLAVQAFSSAQCFLDAALADAPGCIILDVQLPDLNGLDLQRRLADAHIKLPIIFLTGHGDIPMTVRAIKAGAVEFLTKPFRSDDLVRAIETAIERDRASRSEGQDLADLRRRYDSLTSRQREVMLGVVAGRLNKQIAADFGTREATVKEQRATVMTKMGADSVADLVRFATRLGLFVTDGAVRVIGA